MRTQWARWQFGKHKGPVEEAAILGVGKVRALLGVIGHIGGRVEGEVVDEVRMVQLEVEDVVRDSKDPGGL